MSAKNDLRAAEKKLRNLILASKTEIKSFRDNIDKCFGSVFLPNRVECTERDFGGVMCDLLDPEVYVSHRVILYIHGGSFVGGSKYAYRSFCASLADSSSCRTVVPEFRLAPTHPYPASLEDVQAVFKTLYMEEVVARSLDGNDRIPEIVIAADGSGASVALALVLSLKDRFRAAVKRLVLLSPWLDVSPDCKKLKTKKLSDGVMTVECLRRAAELYTYQDNRNNPLVSPLKTDFSRQNGFPPVFIQMGEKELLLDDAKEFDAALKAQGYSCTLDVWDGMINMFQLADEYIEESHLAVERIGRVIKSDEGLTAASDSAESES